MGYRRESRTIRLVFDDPEMEGLEVLTRSVPLGTFMRMVDVAGLSGAKATPESMAEVNALFADFAEHALISWNIEVGDGTPVPPTLDGMKTQETTFMLDVVMTWLGAVGAATGPLVSSSSSGSTSDSPS